MQKCCVFKNTVSVHNFNSSCEYWGRDIRLYEAQWERQYPVFHHVFSPLRYAFESELAGHRIDSTKRGLLVYVLRVHGFARHKHRDQPGVMATVFQVQVQHGRERP
jgi:hypothetical protein